MNAHNHGLYLEHRAFGYTMLMQAMLEDGHVQGVLDLHDHIRDHETKMKPDFAMYGLSIKAYTLSQRFEEAWEVWDYVRSEVGRPDGHLYSIMFGVCDRVPLSIIFIIQRFL